MSTSLFFYSFGNFCVNRLTPNDAHGLKGMYRFNAINSQKTGWKNIPASTIAPRIIALLTAPKAIADAATYEARGILRASVCIIDGKFEKAFKAFVNDNFSAMRLVALAIVNLTVYGGLGFVIGSAVFSSFKPDQTQPKQPRNQMLEEIKTLSDRVSQEIDKLQKQLEDQKQTYEDAIERLNKFTTRVLEREKMDSEGSSSSNPMAIEGKELDDLCSDESMVYQANNTPLDRSLPPESEISSNSKDDEDSIVEGYNKIFTAPSYYQQVIGFFGFASSSVYDFTQRVFIDGKDDWKQQRYALVMDHIKGSFKSKEKKLNDFKSSLDARGLKETADLLQKVLELINPKEKSDSRNQYHELMKAWRQLAMDIEAREKGSSKIDQEMVLKELADAWFTETDLTSFIEELVPYVASKGDQKDVGKDALFSKRLNYLFNGIKNAAAAFLAPEFDVTWAKLWTVVNSYHPFDLTNLPWQWGKMKYEKKDGMDNTVTYESVHVRTCVPVMPSLSKDALQNWEVDDPSWTGGRVRLDPIYMDFLRYRANQRQKVLNILHLNPRFYNAKEGKLKTFGWGDYVSMSAFQHYREALWIQLLVKFSKTELLGAFEVALIPMDGEWLHDMENNFKTGNLERPKTMNQFKVWLTDLATAQEGPFILPGFDNDKAKRVFVERIFEKTKLEYFGNLQEGLLIPNDMLAFYGFFCSKLGEELQIKIEAKVVQQNCREGVDRTMGFVGAQLLEKCSRIERSDTKPLGILQDSDIRERIIVTSLAPALINVKRAPLSGRFRIVNTGIEHLERLERNQRRPAATQDIDGYRLVSVEMGEHRAQSLHRAPSQANDEGEYEKLLDFQFKERRALPSKVNLTSYMENFNESGDEAEQVDDPALKRKGKEKINESEEADVKIQPEIIMHLLQEHYNNSSLEYVIDSSREGKYLTYQLCKKAKPIATIAVSIDSDNMMQWKIAKIA